MRNIKLTIQYDGTDFFGWQRQKRERTVQQVLEDAIADLAGEPPTLVGAGRTDAGVHARAQVANFHTRAAYPPGVFQSAINARIGPDVVILAAEEAPESFHARESARSKRYEYVVYNAPLRPVFDRRFVHHVRARLDLAAMQAAAAPLVGTHDFRCFARRTPSEKNCVRTIFLADVTADGPRITVAVEGTGFLYMMVRGIVGTLLEAGMGKRDAGDVERILAAADRAEAGPNAPPHGLTLVHVVY